MVLCGICSEYALNIKRVSEDDNIFHHIRAYYEDGDISSKTLLNNFKKTNEFNELLGDFDISDQSAENYEKIISSIKWDSDQKENKFTIGTFSFTSNITFIKQLVESDSIYCLTYSDNSDWPRFEAITCGIDSFHYRENTKKVEMAIKIGNKPSIKTTDVIDDETFFTLTNDLRTTDPKQREAIKADLDRNVLIVAGAGSGKTRSLVGRVSYLHLVKGVPLNRIALLTFTNAATDSMRKGALAQLNEAYLKHDFHTYSKPNVMAYTIDAFFKRIIDSYWADIGFSEKPSFLYDKKRDQPERERLLRDVIQSNHFWGMLDGLKNGYYDLYQQVEKYANGIYVSIPGIDVLLNLYVEKQIEQCKIVNFVFASCILEKASSSDDCALYQRINNDYDCILIDEFQDINNIQNKVLSKFYDSVGIHFTFVGDDDQSIYAWRGADNEAIRQMQNDPKVNVIYLTINYRNNPFIVNAGNDILRTMKDRAKSEVLIEAYKKTGSKVHVTRYDNNYSNLAHEVKRIYQTKKKDERVCILCRTLKDINKKDSNGRYLKEDGQGKKIKLALSLESVPVIEINPEDELEISVGYRIIRCLLRIFNKINPKKNSEAMIELLGIDISTVKFNRIIKNRTNFNDFDINNESDSDGIQLYHVCELAEAINPRTEFTNNFTEVVSNYNRTFSKIIEKSDSIEKDVEDETLRSFYNYVEDFNLPYPIDKETLENVFRSFEGTLVKGMKKRSISELPEGVILSTIHSSKGLEYDTVMIVGLNDEEYPNTAPQSEYNRRVNELNRLKKSGEYLDELRSKITDDFLKELIQECSADNDSEDVKSDMDAMKTLIIENQEDFKKLTDVIDYYTDSFFYHVNNHIHKYKLMIEDVNNEIGSIIEEADSVEELLYDLNEGTSKYNECVARINNLNTQKSEKNTRLNNIIAERDNFIKSKAQLINYYDYCLQADKYMRDLDMLRDTTAIVERFENDKITAECEQKRLFYVAVSRAINNLYLCTEEGKHPSQFVSIIRKENCDDYIMQSKEQDDETSRLKSFIDESRGILKKDDINYVEADKAIDKIIENSDKDYLKKYLSKFYENNPQYIGIPQKSAVYFDKAIQLMGLGEKLGFNFRIETIFNLERFLELFLLDRIGEKALPVLMDEESAISIAKDIRRILKERCVIDKKPTTQYFIELLTKDIKYNRLENCKNLIFESYIICSDIYDVSDEIVKTWSIETIKEPEEYMCAAIDLINIRNEMVHSYDEPWATDYIPYAFDCINKIIGGIIKIVR